MQNHLPIKWKYFKSFNRIEEEYNRLEGKQGVYLWIYNGQQHKRVLYVGTGTGKDGLFRRLCTEKAEMLCGKHYSFKYDPKIDPYKVYLIKEPSLISKLVEQQAFYYPDSGIKNAEKFSIKDFLEYQKNLSIFAADLTQTANDRGINVQDLSKFLETQIQVYLLGSEDISYYKTWGFQSWVGRVEKLRKNNFDKDFDLLTSYNFKFSIDILSELSAFETSRNLNVVKEKLKKKL